MSMAEQILGARMASYLPLWGATASSPSSLRSVRTGTEKARAGWLVGAWEMLKIVLLQYEGRTRQFQHQCIRGSVSTFLSNVQWTPSDIDLNTACTSGANGVIWEQTVQHPVALSAPGSILSQRPMCVEVYDPDDDLSLSHSFLNSCRAG